MGINTTLSIFLQPVYGFGPKQIGFFYFTPIVAVIIGEAVGHWLHDIFAKHYSMKRSFLFTPSTVAFLYIYIPGRSFNH